MWWPSCFGWQEKANSDDASASSSASCDPSSATTPPPAAKEEDEAVLASRAFCRALTMLSFDAAYLAWTQGVPIDLLRAGGSALKLLFEAAHTGGGTRRSHLAIPPAPVALQDLDIPQLDFAKLLQLHGLDYPASPVAQSPRKASSRGALAKEGERLSSGKDLGQVSMEESYVDAGREAAGMPEAQSLAVGPKTPSKGSSDSSTSTSIGSDLASNRQKSSAAPSGRHQSRSSSATPTASPLPPDKGLVKPAVASGGLEFLRTRGKLANRPQGSSDGESAKTPTASPVRSGTASPRDLGARSSTASPASSGSKQRMMAAESTGRSTTPSTPTPLSRPPVQPRTASGTVIFNGIEIGGDSSSRRSGRGDGGAGRGEARSAVGESTTPVRASRGEGRSKGMTRKEKEAAADEEWDVV